ncbi:hypothetical protein A9Q81_00345 [Gammaproteobacteria bacterium 42_54_T18]|nr:hypothetical protein A9Q81_00345 [Gammaproteobacteria bacterium 42_54_T18]
MKKLNNKVVLVTGGGSGIGRETAIEFSAQGAHIILSDVNAVGMEESGRLIRKAGGTFEQHVADVASRRDMEALAKEVKNKHGALDVLINNAGIGSAGAFLETTLDTWDKVIDINVKGVVHGCHYFLPDMVAAGKGGSVVNLASMAAFIAPPDMSIYTTSKFAVLGFSESLRNELAKHHIHVATICPGVINTPIVKNTVMEGASGQGELREKAIAMYQRRNYPPQKVALAVLSAVLKQKSVVPVSPEAWLGYYAKRWAPNLVERFGRLELPFN